MKKFTLFVFLLCLSCSTTKTSCFEKIALCVPYKILFKKQLSKEKETQVKRLIETTFDDVNNKLNHWNKDSEISLWNRSKSLDPKKISPLLYDLVITCDKAYKATSKQFDPSLGRLIKLWKSHLCIGKIPTKENIETLAPSCGWDKIIISEQIIQKTHPDSYLDFDGIVKGFFCDLLTKKFKNIGLDDFLIEWGGEISISGGPFSVLIDNKILTLQNTCVATSGHSYLIYPICQKNETILYSHILDPKTHYPLTVTSLSKDESILHKSCAMADAFATAKIIH